MKEYIDYLTERLKTDIGSFTIFSDGSIRVEINPIINSIDRLVFISVMINDLKSIESNNEYEIEIEDFDSESPSILLKAIK